MNDVLDELLMLESSTFEIDEIPDPAFDAGGACSSSTSCSSCSSCSTSSTCSCSSSCSSTS